MRTCKICKVPLDGFLSKIPRVLFKVEPSKDNPEICNKCAGKNGVLEDKHKKPRKYKCQICQKMIDEDHALVHIKTEEYLINLIKKDHPQWQDEGATCRKCIEYYRKLIKQAEI